MQKGNTAIWVIAAVVAGLVVILLFSGGKRGGLTSSTVPCLVEGLPLAQHIHPKLRIIIEGIEQVIPTNIGINVCEHAVHTHDTTGEIHVEAQDSRAYTLGDFFDVWGEPIAKDGYTLEMTVDGAVSQELGALKLKDEQEIVVTYKRATN